MQPIFIRMPDMLTLLATLFCRRFFLLLSILAVSGQNSLAADVGSYVALTSDYVKRGVTQSDGDPAIQLGTEIELENGFYLGAWGSTTDISNAPSRQRDVEVNYYAGYEFSFSESWRFSVGAVAYQYPGQTGNVDYNYEEYSLGTNFDDRVWLEISYSPDLYNTGRSASNIDLFAEWPINSAWFIGGGAGYYDVSDLTDSAYFYFQLGITASLRWADIDLRIHDTDTWVPIISTPDRADSRLVLKITIPF